MNNNRTIHLVDIPIAGHEGSIWHRLHGEREDICEALLKEVQTPSHAEGRRELLQARVRKIDNALDRLMSGSYGLCSLCGNPIEKAALDVDAAWAVCLGCWRDEPRAIRSRDQNKNTDCDPPVVIIPSLNPFDTVLLQTENSEYRILLLDPKTGRALVEGGSYLAEPREALVMGSGLPGSEFNGGTISVGCRLEMWAGDKVLLTSPIKSIEVKHNASAESVQSITEVLH